MNCCQWRPRSAAMMELDLGRLSRTVVGDDRVKSWCGRGARFTHKLYSGAHAVCRDAHSSCHYLRDQQNQANGPGRRLGWTRRTAVIHQAYTHAPTCTCTNARARAHAHRRTVHGQLSNQYNTLVLLTLPSPSRSPRASAGILKCSPNPPCCAFPRSRAIVNDARSFRVFIIDPIVLNCLYYDASASRPPATFPSSPAQSHRPALHA